MKHLLNDLSESEKNRILEQYNNSLTVDTSKFKKLLESKLGNVKPLLNEQSKSVPFKNNTEGDQFRKWVNEKYPRYAAEIQLDPVGKYSNSYNNEYITKAWNKFMGVGSIGETLGDMYSKSLGLSKLARIGAFGGGLDDDKSKIQTDTKPLKYICPIITKTTKLERFDLGNKSQSQLNDLNVILNDYAISYTNQGIPTRISCQAALNKLRPGFRDKNQIIIDSREHLIYVYDKNNKFIAKDAVITGANAQSKIAEVIARSFMDFNDKLEASGFKQTTKGIIDTTGKNRIYNFNYILSKNQEMGSRFLNPGIYTTDKYTTDDAHYAGKKDNVLSLSHLKHGDVLQAIHGFVTTDPNRVAAMNLAKNVLSDPTNPSVGKKFLDMVKLKQINLSQSYGCINVPERFVPYLERYMKDSYVFNISEDENNYLVQNTENYFEKMKEPSCPSPSSLGAEIPAEFDQLSTMS